MKLEQLMHRITESPYLNKSELPYRSLPRIGPNAVERAYKLVDTIDDLNVYYNEVTCSYVIGIPVGNEIQPVVSINGRDGIIPVRPTNLTDIYQVSFVCVDEEFALRGYTKKVYDRLANLMDFVSDHEQYLGAQALWKSLARDSTVNVYVFDGRIGDYMRDEDTGEIIKYNGRNIDDHYIWGSTDTYRRVLIVATSKELK